MFEDMDFGDSLERGDPDLWDGLFHKNIGLWMRAAGRYGFYGNDAKRIIGIAAAEFIKQLNQGKDGLGDDMPMLIEGDLEKLKKKFRNKVGTIAKRERREDPEPNPISIDEDEDEFGLVRALDPNPDPFESYSKVELTKKLMERASEQCQKLFDSYLETETTLNQLKTERELEGKITDTLIFKHIAKSLTVRWRAIQKRFYQCRDKIISSAKKSRTNKDGTDTLWDDLNKEFGT